MLQAVRNSRWLFAVINWRIAPAVARRAAARKFGIAEPR